jgi:hypothetical protein
LAGGLNSYGFASGDPINFTDPFGLDPCERGDISGCLFLTIDFELGSFGLGTKLGKLGGLEFEASPFGTVRASTTYGSSGFSSFRWGFEGGFKASAKANAGPIKGEASAKATGNFLNGTVKTKLSASATMKAASFGSDGTMKVKGAGLSMGVTPHWTDLLMYMTEPAFQWARPGLNYITGWWR